MRFRTAAPFFMRIETLTRFSCDPELARLMRESGGWGSSWRKVLATLFQAPDKPGFHFAHLFEFGFKTEVIFVRH